MPHTPDPQKTMELLHALAEVHRLCRELDFPEVIDQEAAKTVIMACLQRGPQEVKELMLSAFEGSDEIN
jgi:hypothetical protein